MLAGIIGYPLGHSLSPVIHNAGFAALGLDVRYEAWATPPEELTAAVQRMHDPEMLGMSVTIPHKQTVMALLDEIDPVATAIGSVNTIVKRDGRLIGYNTDKDGFMRPLRLAGCDPQGLRALVLGVGGSERAIAYGLVEGGVASIALAGRRPERIAAAATHLASTAPRSVAITQVAWNVDSLGAAADAADLIVNCTPVGMRHTPQEQEAPLAESMLRAGLWVVDIVYNPLETVLLRLARKTGCRAVAGLAMLAYQGAAQQTLWTGREPPVDIMMAAAEAALAEQE
ncbi:MAG TPA: shikimate dehydrogenase [Dehalococcoidia bacterium]|nr:shikimate dehydrogenase [Dehalococcoidia bacterium]